MLRIQVLFFCIFSLLALPSVANERRLYRYIADNGVMVISSKIPSRYVSGGYDVITYDGRLIERVPPEPSPEEKRQLELELKERARLEAWDNQLLRIYSHPDDIEAVKQRKLLEIKNDLRIITRNIEKIDQEINRYHGMAANDERIDGTVAAGIVENISILKKDRLREEARQREKLEEKQELIEKYDKDIARFRTLRPE